LSNAFPEVDYGMATSSLPSSSSLAVGLEQIVNGYRAFINFTEDMLLRGVSTMFSTHSVGKVILADVGPTKEVIAVCNALVHKGYM
jgi:EAL and modified HD-GYP domain-containing signal transduction protein